MDTGEMYLFLSSNTNTENPNLRLSMDFLEYISDFVGILTP